MASKSNSSPHRLDDCFRARYSTREKCAMLDCRHGRVLLCSLFESSGFVVWDPIADCDLGDCRGCPFFVVLVNTNHEDDEDGVWFSQACVYSSETGEWSALDCSSTGFKDQFYIDELPSALAGDVLYFSCERGAVVLRYDICGEGGLSMINGPSENIYGAVLTPAVEGGLRCAGLMGWSDRLVLWSLEAIDADGVAGWTQVAVVHLNTLPPIVASTASTCLPYLIGSAKDRDSDVFFVSTDFDIFAIEVESRKTKKVWENVDGRSSSLLRSFFHYTSFLTPDCSVGRLSFPMESS